jgi:hypothetical protein
MKFFDVDLFELMFVKNRHDGFEERFEIIDEYSRITGITVTVHLIQQFPGNAASQLSALSP